MQACFSIALVFMARWLPLLTGTPAGVGLPRDTFLAVGDVVEVEIGGIGRITHTIIAPD